MRLLNEYEIQDVSGGIFYDDIKAVVLALKAGSYVADFGCAMGKGAASMIGGQVPALSGVLKTTLPVIGSYANPIGVCGYVLWRHPELNRGFWDKFYQYF